VVHVMLTAGKDGACPFVRWLSISLLTLALALSLLESYQTREASEEYKVFGSTNLSPFWFCLSRDKLTEIFAAMCHV
jgi:hypothetical protein